MDKSETWKLIESELMAAYELLTQDIKESADGYCEETFLEYIEHNELFLVMEELDGVHVDNPLPPKQFWTHLINADKLMGSRHSQTYESIRDAAT